MEIEVGINNFKSIKKTTLKLENGLNILVGPNGAGKSCIFSSLKFLKDIFDKGTAQALARAGGPKQVFRRGSKRIVISIEGDYGARIFKKTNNKHIFVWSVTIAQKGRDKLAEIIEEKFSIWAIKNDKKIKVFYLTKGFRKNDKAYVNVKLLRSMDWGFNLFSEWKEKYRSKNDVFQNFTKRLKYFGRRKFSKARVYSDYPFVRFLFTWDNELNSVFNSILSLNEYNIIPDIARRPSSQQPTAHMEPNGFGVAEVVNALETKQYFKIEDQPRNLSNKFIRFRNQDVASYIRRQKRLAKLKEVLGKVEIELNAAVHLIDGVTTEMDPSTGNRYILFKSGKDRFNFAEISDGTVKWLCILISIFVPHSTIYLIEEPENFLHPWMQQRLISTMREQAKETNTIFLLTTHSTTILNSAHPEELRVVSCTRSGTKVKGLKKMSELKKFLASSEFNLGDLWISGAISGVPANE